MKFCNIRKVKAIRLNNILRSSESEAGVGRWFIGLNVVKYLRVTELIEMVLAKKRVTPFHHTRFSIRKLGFDLSIEQLS